jgi:hypothetical protein
MSPGRYTELFFLDEAVALAAGHRPCAECRRERFNAFKNAWIEPRGGGPLLADEIDAELHRWRFDRVIGKVSYQSSMDSLPDGCFIQVEGSSYMVWGDTLLLWSQTGYVKKRLRPFDSTVSVLTPAPIVRCIRGGYRPVIHESALAL